MYMVVYARMCHTWVYHWVYEGVTPGYTTGCMREGIMLGIPSWVYERGNHAGYRAIPGYMKEGIMLGIEPSLGP